MICENLKEVEAKIEAACKRAGRDRSEVTLIAVSKTKPVEMLEEAYGIGIREFGENKVQEMMDKYEVMPKDIHWHMIGHLQRNKVKYLMGKAALIHSVDSLRLAVEISAQSVKHSDRGQYCRRRDKIWYRQRGSNRVGRSCCKTSEYPHLWFDDDCAVCRKFGR